MIIISSFKDYYDGYATRDRQDFREKMWIREKKEVDFSLEKLLKAVDNYKQKRIYRTFYKGSLVSYESGLLVISGVLFPVIIRKFTDGRKAWEYFYSYDSLINAYPDAKRLEGGFFGYDLKAFFKTDLVHLDDLCIELGSPVLLFSHPENTRYRHIAGNTISITINPVLKDIGFSKCMDSPSVYQLLDYFVSNVLVNDEMPTYPRTDIEKLESHGFDKKTSFRKPKST
jgi:hypothetical protein